MENELFYEDLSYPNKNEEPDYATFDGKKIVYYINRRPIFTEYVDWYDPIKAKEILSGLQKQYLRSSKIDMLLNEN